MGLGIDSRFSRPRLRHLCDSSPDRRTSLTHPGEKHIIFPPLRGNSSPDFRSGFGAKARSSPFSSGSTDDDCSETGRSRLVRGMGREENHHFYPESPSTMASTMPSTFETRNVVDNRGALEDPVWAIDSRTSTYVYVLVVVDAVHSRVDRGKAVVPIAKSTGNESIKRCSLVSGRTDPWD